MSTWATPTPTDDPTTPTTPTMPELSELDRVTEALQRAWIRADDESIETVRRRVEALMESCPPEQRERLESALARLERARRQARLRHRRRH